jgi:transcriptional regulator GlxA family with amidase domain
VKLGIPVYEGVNLLDVTGPWEMFRWVNSSKKLETVLLSLHGGPVTTINGLRFEVHASFAATPALDVLWVPGGAPEALAKMMADPAVRCCSRAPDYLTAIGRPRTGRSSSACSAFRKSMWTRPTHASSSRGIA